MLSSHHTQKSGKCEVMGILIINSLMAVITSQWILLLDHHVVHL